MSQQVTAQPLSSKSQLLTHHSQTKVVESLLLPTVWNWEKLFDRCPNPVADLSGMAVLSLGVTKPKASPNLLNSKINKMLSK